MAQLPCSSLHKRQRNLSPFLYLIPLLQPLRTAIKTYRALHISKNFTMRIHISEVKDQLQAENAIHPTPKHELHKNHTKKGWNAIQQFYRTFHLWIWIQPRTEWKSWSVPANSVMLLDFHYSRLLLSESGSNTWIKIQTLLPHLFTCTLKSHKWSKTSI